MLDEARRLKKVRSYDILDTPAETSFDDVALLVSKICDVPIGLVCFVDRDRHWYKAKVGIDATEIAARDAVCTHALEGSDEFLIIDDLTLDPRTRNSPVVTGAPHLRFYASVLLRTPDNVAIGTLCAVDFEPRSGGLSEVQKSGLAALARHTMALLWFRATVARDGLTLSNSATH